MIVGNKPKTRKSLTLK